MGKKKRKHKTAYKRACDRIETEGIKECILVYSSTALALHRNWGKGKKATLRLFDISRDIWHECAETTAKSMIQMCEQETGIEVQNGTGKSWEDLPYLNGSLHTRTLSNAQWVYMRQQQVKWISAQVTACMLVALHRRYGFGFERCARFYQQIQDIQEEHNRDPKKLHDLCEEETKIDVERIVTRRSGDEEKTDEGII